MAARAESPVRDARGLMALYDFQQVKDAIIPDVSGVSPKLDLVIKDGKHVSVERGFLRITGSTQISSEQNVAGFADVLRQTNELTLEAWVKPANLKQEGPARIVTISKNPSERNATLGQQGDQYDVRLRTTRTTTNGIPSLSSPKKIVQTQLQHVVYSRNRFGLARLFVDGRVVGEEKIVGDLRNWDNGYHLALANEVGGDRVWQGEIHLVAIYNRSLTPDDARQHFRAGPNAATKLLAEKKTNPNAELFETRIAGILAKHCLECHDPATKKGGLDLSQKSTAFAASDSGKTLIPGKLSESDLWVYVESDEMPKKRTALSAQEKEALKTWIAGGATWTFETIDPALYQHQSDGVRTFVRRLTVDEFTETVRVIFDVDISQEAKEILPPDLRADGFTNTGYNLTVDLGHVDAFAQLAEIIVNRLDVKKFAQRFEKSEKLTDDNMRKLVENMGRWVLRGPLDADEINIFRGISTTVASAGGNFEEAVGFILQSMIQSPRFIYIMERERGLGESRIVTGYELANRLSYIIWGGPPDKPLLDAAERFELQDEEKLHKHVTRMLADPRARTHSKDFISQWLNLNRLNHLSPDPKLFPNWSPQIAKDMQQETLRYFEDVVWEQQRPLADLLNAQVTYLSPELAKHYGLSPQGNSIARYELEAVSSRGGLLTQGSVLTIGGDEASMVTRGLFVLHDLLRGTVKDPPPCVDTTPVPTKPGLTNRDVAEMRLKNNACGGCHARFEPLAFGLERFDGLGTYRVKDQYGNTLREDGQILIPGSAEKIAYENSTELMNLLAKSERVQESLTWKVTQFCLGRPLVAADARQVQQIHEESQSHGGTWYTLIMAIVTSDLVKTSPTVSLSSEEKR
ncbi:MAG: DUF1592 domain-containing protein [Planctomycetaceae bacterium]|nr:DUF1592 domain-containing protein [Planctomycetaceae bacterium]